VIKLALLLELVVIMLGCARPKPLQEKPKEMTASNLVSRVVSTLADSRRSGSLVYEGACARLERITDSFRVSTPTSGAPAVQALHDAFANEPKLTVEEDASGRIRVVGGNVHTDLLDLRISQISFHSEDNPRDATATLLTLPEVKAYMQSHHIHFVNAMGGFAPMPKGIHSTLRSRMPRSLGHWIVSPRAFQVSGSTGNALLHRERDSWILRSLSFDILYFTRILSTWEA
jgi:hypothetical protein